MIPWLIFFLLDDFNQAFVKFGCTILAYGFEFLVESGHFDEACQVSPHSYGDGDMGDKDIENFKIFLIESDPIDLFEFLPIFKCDDQVKSFFCANASDSKDGHDIDDAEAPDFHVVAGQFGGIADEFFAFEGAEASHVVAD